MNANPWTAYRQHTARSASAAGVFIQCCDQVISLLHSAARAIEARDIEKKTLDLNRALTLIVHLQGSLDFERGGEATQLLDRFYTFARGEIFKGSAKLDAGMLRQVATHFAEVRKVWEQSEKLVSQTGGNNFSSLPPSAPRPSQNDQPFTHSSDSESPAPSRWSA